MKNLSYLLIGLLAVIMTISCGLEGDSILDSGGTFESDRSGTNSGNSGPTLSGSYATILPVNDYIYAVNNQELVTFKKEGEGVTQLDKQEVGFRIENLFYNDGVLLIGSEGAMYIYSIGNDGIPVHESATNYVDLSQMDVGPCDPVIARGNYAYVTLSTTQSGRCFRQIPVNEMRIYNIEDLKNPELIASVAMSQPKGLGLKGDYLLVCEAESGLRVFDISTITEPELINSLEGFQAYDLIVNGEKLSIVNSEELLQFDISDINNIVQLGSINL